MRLPTRLTHSSTSQANFEAARDFPDTAAQRDTGSRLSSRIDRPVVVVVLESLVAVDPLSCDDVPGATEAAEPVTVRHSGTRVLGERVEREALVGQLLPAVA